MCTSMAFWWPAEINESICKHLRFLFEKLAAFGLVINVNKCQFNHNNIPLTNSVKYLGVILDNKLTWQPHIEQIRVKLSRACGMIFKLRHYVTLSTLKLIYYSMFHSVLQYSLINWGRASTVQNTYFIKLKLFKIVCYELV